MTEYSRMAKGSYTVSGGSIGSTAPSVKIINLPFKPDYVELINYIKNNKLFIFNLISQYWYDIDDAKTPTEFLDEIMNKTTEKYDCGCISKTFHEKAIELMDSMNSS